MNIIVDGRAFVKTAAGITNFLKCSLRELAKQLPNDRFIVVLPKQLHPSLENLDMPGNVQFKVYETKWSNKIPNFIWLQIILPFIVRKYKAKLYYSPVPYIPFFLPSHITKLIVVHDVVNLEYKSTMAFGNRISSAMYFERSIKKADFIWTNSNYTKEKVNKYIPNRKCNDIYVGGSAERELYHKIVLTDDKVNDLKKALGIKDRFLMFVGSLEPRKNLSFLLNLMPELFKRYNYQLLVVGGKGWKENNIKDIVMASGYPKDSTIFAGYITNEQLAMLYNIADCFVSTSLNEGFGMPQLEAMLCGCPVVTADNSAMKELAENEHTAITVSGWKEEDWVQTIHKTIESGYKPNVQNLKKYDWKIIVHNLLMRIKLS